MKMNVFAMIVDAIIAINYENLHNANNAIAINFVANEANVINSSINFEINSYNFTIFDVDACVKKILTTNITIYDNVNTRIKFANVIANYSNL
jgi:hypothetical protein